MKQFKQYFKKICDEIHLVDKCLIIIMFLLIAQSIYNLFFNELNNQEVNTIDIMIRTTSAAVFGYFISANFIKNSINIQRELGEEAQDQTQLKKQDLTETESDVQPEKENKTYKAFQYNRIQIIIVAIIGIAALITLLAARNFTTLTASMYGTVSQLRDFVSGCVGFLIGCNTNNEKQ